MRPNRYIISLFDKDGNLITTLDTFGGWMIEGNFVSTFDDQGNKVSHRIPDTCTLIDSVLAEQGDGMPALPEPPDVVLPLPPELEFLTPPTPAKPDRPEHHQV